MNIVSNQCVNCRKLDELNQLMVENEAVKSKSSAFKEKCRNDAEDLKNEIE